MHEPQPVLDTPDGPMDAHVARPDAPAPHAAVVVIQEAFGVNDHIRDVCRRFAEAGYLAVAPEIFHRAGRGVTVSYDDVPSAMARIAALTNGGIERDVSAALAYARGRPDVAPGAVGLVGFCVGGFAAFLGACRCAPAATVSFYGGGIARARPGFQLRPLIGEHGGIGAPILCVFGGEDKGIPPEDVETIRRALDTRPVPHDVIVYPGAPHAFFNDLRAAHHAEAARDAWSRTLDWLGRYLRPGTKPPR
jgi:carboxymethylenebutenolidase